MQKNGDRSYRRENKGLTVTLDISGIGRQNAARTAEKILTTGEKPSFVLSIGFGGALREEMCPGDLALDIEKSGAEPAKNILGIAQENHWTIHQGSFQTIDRMLTRPEEKKDWSSRTEAIVVEMENEAILKVCREKGMTFCALRSISDAADQTLPSSLSRMDPSGKITMGFLKTLMVRPGDWIDFLKLIRSSSKAERSLAKMVSALVHFYEDRRLAH